MNETTTPAAPGTTAQRATEAENISNVSDYNTPPPEKQDLTLIKKIKRSRNGAAFSALWDGDMTGYHSHAEAVRALCDTLTWWTNRDPERVDRLFRASALYTDEWDTDSGGGTTYGQAVIQAACRDCQSAYNPAAHFKGLADKITVSTESGSRTLADFHPESNYRLTDLGAGRLFADWYKSRARYCPARKKWMIYNGRIWDADEGNVKTMELCKGLADALVVYGLSLPESAERDAFRKYAENWQNRRYREVVLKDAASVYPVSALEFDKDPFTFNCQNGTLNLRDFSFRPHNAADMLSIVSGVNYDPDAKSPLWESTVNDIFQGDRALIVFTQKLYGKCLTGDTSDDRFYIKHGLTTRNGKSTMCETLHRLLGRGYCRSVKPETLAQRKYVNASAPSEDLARLMGARAVIVSEPDKNMTLSAGLIKTLSGGDTLSARNLNESTIEFTPCAKVILNANHLPRIDDSTVFTSGRVCVIPYSRHFREDERDTHREEKLASPENLSGILNWCLDGLRLIYEVGFAPPEPVKLATDEYWEQSDKARRFFAERLIRNPDGEIRTQEVYAQYFAWCAANGQCPESAENFKKNLAPYAQCRLKRPKGAGKSAAKLTLFCGVSWRQEA